VYFSCFIISSLLLSSANVFSQSKVDEEEPKKQGTGNSPEQSRFEQEEIFNSTPTSIKKYYMKVLIGGGVSFDDISMHMTAESQGGSSTKNVTLDTGGLNISGTFGYHLSPKWILESTFGYQSSVETPEVEDADCSFTKLYLMANILRQFHLKKMWNLYYGGGITYNFPAKMVRESDSDVIQVKNEVEYGSSLGINLIFGGEIRTSNKVPLYVTLDGIIILGTDYSYDKHTEDGIQIDPFPDWEKVGSSQAQVNIGLKYYI